MILVWPKFVYRKTQTNLLANPILCYSSLSRLRQCYYSLQGLCETPMPSLAPPQGTPWQCFIHPCLSLVTQNDLWLHQKASLTFPTDTLCEDLETIHNIMYYYWWAYDSHHSIGSLCSCSVISTWRRRAGCFPSQSSSQPCASTKDALLVSAE